MSDTHIIQLRVAILYGLMNKVWAITGGLHLFCLQVWIRVVTAPVCVYVYVCCNLGDFDLWRDWTPLCGAYMECTLYIYNAALLLLVFPPFLLLAHTRKQHKTSPTFTTNRSNFCRCSPHQMMEYIRTYIKKAVERVKEPLLQVVE
jgi:hypothetical protein